MKFSFYIAKRYLFSRKSTHAINIIAMISMAGICVGSAALIIILSVFNGFEALNISLYNKLSPDLEISSAKGKFFETEKISLAELSSMPEVDHTVKVLADNALLKYGDVQYFAVVKGVDENFIRKQDVKSVLSSGEFVLEEDSQDYAVIGSGIEYALGIDVTSPLDQISIFSPKKTGTISTLNPEKSLKRMEIFPSGVFSTEQEMDDQVIFVPFRFAKKLFEENSRLSSIEIYLKNDDDLNKVQSALQKKLGADFMIKNRYQLNEILYKVLNTEKWAVYLILTFILTIAICNIIGSVTMLVIDKKKDIGILMSMGCDAPKIRSIFLIEGLLISMTGAVIGLSAGGIFSFLQQEFGLIKIQTSGMFLIDAYPVRLHTDDFLLVFATVFIISFIASWFTARQSVKNFGSIRENLSEE
jgi:lipoprotein-releasing system permease protein